MINENRIFNEWILNGECFLNWYVNELPKIPKFCLMMSQIYVAICINFSPCIAEPYVISCFKIIDKILTIFPIVIHNSQWEGIECNTQILLGLHNFNLKQKHYWFFELAVKFAPIWKFEILVDKNFKFFIFKNSNFSTR